MRQKRGEVNHPPRLKGCRPGIATILDEVNVPRKIRQNGYDKRIRNTATESEAKR